MGNNNINSTQDGGYHSQNYDLNNIMIENSMFDHNLESMKTQANNTNSL